MEELVTFVTEILGVNELLSGAVGGVAGGFFAHWLALGRDKRREYNEAVEPLLLTLLRNEDALRSGGARPYALTSRKGFSESEYCYLVENAQGSIN